MGRGEVRILSLQTGKHIKTTEFITLYIQYNIMYVHRITRDYNEEQVRVMNCHGNKQWSL